MDSDNAASRLHDALEAYDAKRIRTGGQAPVAAWQTALGTKTEFETMLKLQQLGSLVPDVVWWAKNQGPPRLKDPVLRHAPTWMSVLSPGLTDSVQPTRYQVSADALVPLASAAEMMDIGSSTNPLTASERQESLDQLRDLRDIIQADKDLPSDLRTVILDRLREVEGALETWSSGGTDALARALESLSGVIILGAAGMNEDDEVPSSLNRAMQFTSKIYKAISVSVTLKEGALLALTGTEAFGLLPPGTSAAIRAATESLE